MLDQILAEGYKTRPGHPFSPVFPPVSCMFEWLFRVQNHSNMQLARYRGRMPAAHAHRACGSIDA